MLGKVSFSVLFQIKHIEGYRKIMPDIMTRWLRRNRGHQKAVNRVAHRLLREEIVPSLPQEDFTWLDIIKLL